MMELSGPLKSTKYINKIPAIAHVTIFLVFSFGSLAHVLGIARIEYTLKYILIRKNSPKYGVSPWNKIPRISIL